MSALTQQLDELDTLHAEAQEVRKRLVVDAVERVRKALEVGLRPLHDDVRIVQAFMGERTQQDRYGK